MVGALAPRGYILTSIHLHSVHADTPTPVHAHTYVCTRMHMEAHSHTCMHTPMYTCNSSPSACE